MKRTRCALRAPLCAWALACASVALPALAAGQPPAAVLASAAPVASSYLPPDAAVEAALQAQPGVRAAAARLEAARASRQALRVGSHEYEASMGAQRRRVRGEGHYNEWELQLSRAVRLPGKARLDDDLGQRTEQVADLRLADAEHQAARRLLELWMQWLRSSLAAQTSAAQRQLLAQELQAVQRRVALGDAAQRDLEVLQAEHAVQVAQALADQEQADVAQQALVREFPALPVPGAAPSALPEPTPLPPAPGGAPSWRERIVQESAEIATAEGEVARLQQLAARVRAERTPDPRVGVRMLSDKGGAERTVGVVLSVPLGGDYRAALAAQESAMAAAAEAEALQVRRTVEQGAWVAEQGAVSRLAQWQAHQRALQAHQAASERTRRAWELGEATLSEHLLAQRQLHQARLTEVRARVEALQAALLVRIDAHALWHGAHAAEPAQAPAE